MGFGLLFIGYLFMYSFPYLGFDVVPDIIGFVISYIGIKSLSEYGCGWDTLKKYFSILLPSGLLTLIFQAIGLFGVKHFVVDLWFYIYSALLLIYNVLLLMAIYKIAVDTDSHSIKAKAQRNLFLGIVYYIIMLFLNCPIPVIQKLNVYLSTHYTAGFILYIFGYIWQFLNLALIFSCYMWICTEEDKEMPIKNKKLFKKKDEE